MLTTATAKSLSVFSSDMRKQLLSMKINKIVRIILLMVSQLNTSLTTINVNYFFPLIFLDNQFTKIFRLVFRYLDNNRKRESGAVPELFHSWSKDGTIDEKLSIYIPTDSVRVIQ